MQLEKDRCRVLLVGQVTTLSLSKQGFESPTRYTKKLRVLFEALFFFITFAVIIKFLTEY